MRQSLFYNTTAQYKKILKFKKVSKIEKKKTQLLGQFSTEFDFFEARRAYQYAIQCNYSIEFFNYYYKLKFFC